MRIPCAWTMPMARKRCRPAGWQATAPRMTVIRRVSSLLNGINCIVCDTRASSARAA